MSDTTSSSLPNSQTPLARVVSMDMLSDCASRLRSGHLVAFPTETVYGLGCHALSEEAILRVFAAKERPLTDPLIVHLLNTQAALPLWDPTHHRLLTTLADEFWPGPLTLVAKAATSSPSSASPVVVPSLIMAGTGFVACRCPSHPVARALLRESQLPLAAPSANKFGHVSPTSAQHVYDDLQHENVWILEEKTNNENSPACRVGVESTVAKLEQDARTLTVLRQGAISVQELETCLRTAGYSEIQVRAKQKPATKHDDVIPQVAPGQTLRHYSPNIPSFMLSSRFQTNSCDASSVSSFLQDAVVLDFGGRLVDWKDRCLSYHDLSPVRDSREAARTVFERLRWAEQIPGARRIYFPALVRNNNDTAANSGDDALLLAVQDRLTRAANGVVLERPE